MKEAVNAYLASIPAAERARSDAYFDGRCWLLVWDFVLTVAIALGLLATGLSVRMRDVAERVVRREPLRAAIYWAQFAAVTALLSLPFTAYRDFIREQQYGLMSQSFGAWLGDRVKLLIVTIVLGALLLAVLFALVRRLPRTWWLWCSVTTVVFLTFKALIVPVFIAPLFNRYTPLRDARVREPIEAMARGNGVEAEEVWVMDASRQSRRIGASVSGLLSTERIALSDNLLRRCAPPEVEAVVAHELGHRVLNHTYKTLLFFGLEALAFFAFLRWTLGRALVRWGRRWRVRDVTDPAVLPLVWLLGSLFLFVATPLNNTWTRAMEQEADLFGLNAARQPDGAARAYLLVGEYRKLDPGPLQEALFYDHPSGRARITAAMRWKAAQLDERQRPQAGPTTPPAPTRDDPPRAPTPRSRP